MPGSGGPGVSAIADRMRRIHVAAKTRKEFMQRLG
jgi:hypothetical protein